MQDVKRIESYGLYDFCQDIESAFKEGYVFDFSTNENFPTAYGTMLTCGLVKPTSKEVEVEAKVEEVAEIVTETEQTEQTEEVAEIITETETEQTEQVVQDEAQSEAEATPAKRGPKPKAK